MLRMCVYMCVCVKANKRHVFPKVCYQYTIKGNEETSKESNLVVNIASKRIFIFKTYCTG
jgi:hypothetical protein